MTTTKITKRERFESIKALCEYVGSVEGFDIDGIVEFCDKEMATLANRAEKAKERAAEKRAQGDELQVAVLNALTDEFATRADVFERVMAMEGVDPETTIAKVGYRLTALVNAGKATKGEASVVGEDGKTKKLAAYALA